jgi:hypothetical protein
MNPSRRGYPLGALFVLVAVCAVLIAGSTPVVRETVSGKGDVGAFLAAILIGGLAGLLLGIGIGLFQFRYGLGAALGGLAGTVIGAVSGPMALLTRSQVSAAAAAMTIGSGLVIAVALVMRRVDAKQ